jgi:hypothetical protein
LVCGRAAARARETFLSPDVSRTIYGHALCNISPGRRRGREGTGSISISIIISARAVAFVLGRIRLEDGQADERGREQGEASH